MCAGLRGSFEKFSVLVQEIVKFLSFSLFDLLAFMSIIMDTCKQILLKKSSSLHFYHHPRTPSMELPAIRASFTKEDIRTLIKFHVLLNKSAMEIHTILRETLQEFAPSYETVRTWSNVIKGGQHEMKDAPRSERPLSATTPQTVQRVEELLAEDRRLTCEQIALSLDISANSAYRIIKENLGKRKICAKWIPHALTEEHVQSRASTCASHLRRFRRERQMLLERIVACDETWAYS